MCTKNVERFERGGGGERPASVKKGSPNYFFFFFFIIYYKYERNDQFLTGPMRRNDPPIKYSRLDRILRYEDKGA